MPGVAVVTMTLARSNEEADLLARSLARLSIQRWPLIVTDGGSTDELVGRLGRIEHVQVLRATGLVPQLKRSIVAALETDADFLLYTEPDKDDFFRQHVGSLVEQSRGHMAAGRVLACAARSPAAFQTFPPSQQRAEREINRLCSESLGVSGDFSYGPFLMPRLVASHVSRAPDDLGWGWRHFIFAVASRLGCSLRMIEGDYLCPMADRLETEEDARHRESQLRQNRRGLVSGLSVPLNTETHPQLNKTS
jgi:hypothetical protein